MPVAGWELEKVYNLYFMVVCEVSSTCITNHFIVHCSYFPP